MSEINDTKFGSGNIESLTIKNKNYRKVINTTKESQLVLMNLIPGEYIHDEIHSHTTQFIRVEKGNGVAIINGKKKLLQDNTFLMIPSGYNHKIINTSKKEDLKLYTVYSPPEHSPNKINKRMPKE